MKHLFYIILISLFCFNITAFAQNPDWINYTDKSLINAIEFECNFIWLGTTAGVVKYDKVTGNKICFNKTNSGIPRNNVSCIAIDEAGNKWIGTGKWDDGGGLAKFDGTEWTVYNTSNSDIPSNTINCITIDEAGNKWIGTNDGLAKFDNTTWEVHNPPLQSIPINCIAIDEFGDKWIGTDAVYDYPDVIGGGLLKLDGEDWIRYDTVGITMQSGVSSIAIDIDGSIWVGDERGGLAKFDGVSCTMYWTPSQPWNGVVSLAIDNEGNKWIGSDYSGLGKFDNVNWQWYEPFNLSLSGRGVRSIKIDDSGNKWIGCRYVQGWSGDYVGVGLVKYDDTEFTFIDNFSEELLSNDVRCITIDGENNKWIGTFGGLSKFDGSEWSMYNQDNSGLPGNFIKCLAADSNGDLWIGSDYSGGLTKFDGTDWIVYDETNSGLPQYSRINCIAIDDMDTKWVGTWKGLVKFDDTDWITYNKSNSGLPFNNIRCIAIDHSGNYWIGGYDYDTEIGGLVKYDGEWTFYNSSNSGLPYNYIDCIAIDASGDKWIGTWEGLAKFDGANWEVYNTSNSDIPSNTINCITIDDSENKWIGTWEGLAKFDGTNWQVYNTSNSGLPNHSVTCVTTDIYGNTWIGTGADGGGGYGGGLAVFNEGGVVSVEENSNEIELLPSEYQLCQNYPNPFSKGAGKNSVTTIEYSIPAGGEKFSSPTKVTLKVYDILGREIATLVDAEQSSGNYSARFTAEGLSAGVYFYRLQAGNFARTKKMIIVR